MSGIWGSFWRNAKRGIWFLLLLILIYQVWVFVHVLTWKWVNPDESRFMSLRLVEMREKNPKAMLKQQWVDYEQMSSHVKRAVVAAEDDRFMAHYGFDLRGIKHALNKNQRKGKSVAGGSTITQQLAKNLFLSPSRSYIRKAQEAVITLMIESLWSKRRILEVYLNMVEWGNGVFGVEAAARHYYRTSAANLGPSQAAHIAVMLPNPRLYEKSYPPRVAAHSRRVQARMRYSQIP